MEIHVIEAKIRYRTTEEGGRRSGGVVSGYRGQFHYDGADFDGFQYFPDLDPQVLTELGQEIRTFVLFPLIRWEQVHKHVLQVGKLFEIREGAKTVGEGIVTRLDVPAIEWEKLITS
jgi:translation elongation factor EF-Tu-like GTPase